VVKEAPWAVAPGAFLMGSRACRRGQPGRIRTGGVPFMRRLLCPLSYRLWRRGRESNPDIGRLCKPPPAPARTAPWDMRS
jgi:hypothetical protein